MPLVQRINDLEICPICNEREIYKKVRTVNDGYAIQNPNGTYYFKKLGEVKKMEKWWSCKPCTKKMKAGEYNDFLVANQHKILTNP